MTDMTVNVTPERLKKAIATAQKKFAATLDPSRRAILDETIKTLQASLAVHPEELEAHRGPPPAIPEEKPKKARRLVIHTETARDVPAEPTTTAFVDTAPDAQAAAVLGKVTKTKAEKASKVVVPMASSSKAFQPLPLPASFAVVLGAVADDVMTVGLRWTSASRTLELASGPRANGAGEAVHARWVITGANNPDWSINVTREVFLAAVSRRGSEGLIKYEPGATPHLRCRGTPDVMCVMASLDDVQKPAFVAGALGAARYAKARLTNLERALAYATDVVSSDITRPALTKPRFVLFRDAGTTGLRILGTDGHRLQWSDMHDVPKSLTGQHDHGVSLHPETSWIADAVCEVAQRLGLDENQPALITLDAVGSESAPTPLVAALREHTNGWRRPTAGSSLAAIHLPLEDGLVYFTAQLTLDEASLGDTMTGRWAEMSVAGVVLEAAAGPWNTMITTAQTSAVGVLKRKEKAEALANGVHIAMARFQGGLSTEVVTTGGTEKWRCDAKIVGGFDVWTEAYATYDSRYLLDASCIAEGDEKVRFTLADDFGPACVEVGTGLTLEAPGNLRQRALIMPLRSGLHGIKGTAHKAKAAAVKPTPGKATKTTRRGKASKV